MPRRLKIDLDRLVTDMARVDLQERGLDGENVGANLLRWRWDPVEFINECHLLPSDLHPRQVEIIWEIITIEGDEDTRELFFEDTAINKTRQVGMSWLLMALELWVLVFHPTKRILNASRKFNDVDDGGSGSSPLSLHGRLRFMYEHRCPGWIQRRYPLEFKKGLITTKYGGYAHASTATTDVGRGGTFDFAVLDEFAHVEWSRQVWASASQACKRGKIINSTPKGKGNEFFRLCSKAKARLINYLTYHWSEHPDFSVGMETDEEGKLTSPWYRAQCAIIGDQAMIAQELDMSFEQSVAARVYPNFDREKHLGKPARNEATPLVCAWDYGYAGQTCMILAQLERLADRTEIQVLAAYADRGHEIDYYVPTILEWGREYGPIKHVGDPAGVQKTVASGRGPVHALQDHGIHTETPLWLHRDAIEGIRAVRVCLGGRPLTERGLPITVVIDEDCLDLADSLENVHYPVDSQGVRKPGAEMPADNEYTHLSDAFRYLVHYIARSYLGFGSQGDGEGGVEDPGGFTRSVLTRSF